MENLVINLIGKARRVIEDGKEYLVAPSTLIVPGVLNGSKGPLLYETQEIAKNHRQWNGMPLVIYHPHNPITNQPLSTQDPVHGPGVIEKQGVGEIRNTTANGKLKAEAWFDVARLGKVSPKTLQNLRAGKQVELSTGLFTDNVDEAGSFNGKPYVAKATSFRADHIAVLPDQIGACSISDGCGVLVNSNNPEGHNQYSSHTAGQINKLLDKVDKDSSKHSDEMIAAGRGYERPSDRVGKTDELSLRGQEIADRHAALRAEVTKRYGPNAPSRLPKGFGPIKPIKNQAPTANVICKLQQILNENPHGYNQYSGGTVHSYGRGEDKVEKRTDPDRHEAMRIATMGDQALETRVEKITKADKLKRFGQALHSAGKHAIAKLAESRLKLLTNLESKLLALNGLVINPFVSEAQRRYLWSQEPDIAEAWAHGEHTSDKDHKMPEDTGRDVKGPLAEAERKAQRTAKKLKALASKKGAPLATANKLRLLANDNPQGINQYTVGGAHKAGVSQIKNLNAHGFKTIDTEHAAGATRTWMEHPTMSPKQAIKKLGLKESYKGSGEYTAHTPTHDVEMLTPASSSSKGTEVFIRKFKKGPSGHEEKMGIDTPSTNCLCSKLQAVANGGPGSGRKPGGGKGMDARDKLRSIQDKLLQHPDVKTFVAEHGENKPLWEGGPSHSQLKTMIHPAHQSYMESYLAQHPVRNSLRGKLQAIVNSNDNRDEKGRFASGGGSLGSGKGSAKVHGAAKEGHSGEQRQFGDRKSGYRVTGGDSDIRAANDRYADSAQGKHGWQCTSESPKLSTFVHPKHEGHHIEITSRGSWNHTGPEGYAKPPVAQGKSQKDLAVHLAEFHKEPTANSNPR